LISFREQISQKLYRNKAENSQKQFAEYILIETTRALYKIKPVSFYIYLRNHQRLRGILKLQYLTSYDKWRAFDRKRKYFKNNFENAVKRNLKKRVGNMYILDDLTLSLVENYDSVKKKRSRIEYVFKTAKLIFGMKDLHVYFRDAAFWKVYIQLYIASLFLQYLEINNVNIHRAIERLRQNHGLM
jgi:hypothetical protein